MAASHPPQRHAILPIPRVPLTDVHIVELPWPGPAPPLLKTVQEGLPEEKGLQMSWGSRVIRRLVVILYHHWQNNVDLLLEDKGDVHR